MAVPDVDGGYVLGHSARELARLEAQAGFFSEPTRDGLIKAGLKPGMHVLDLGSGAGDVALIAADIVGSTGSVTGIDISPNAVALANARASALNMSVRFQHAAIDAYDAFSEYDVVISRFLLVHFPDPAAVVREIAGKVRPGTPIVSMEMDMSTAGASSPFPLYGEILERIRRVYQMMGLNADMGLKLHPTYRAAGLDCRATAFTQIGHRDERAGFDFLAESVRSLLPAMEKLGIARSDEIDVDSLSARLAAEAAANDPAIFYPRFVVAWANA